MKNTIFKAIVSRHKNEISKQVKRTVMINVSNRSKNHHPNYTKCVNMAKLL